MELFLKNSHIEGCIEAGADEAGRGPLAGPVFAAAVILPPDFHHPLLNDSKQVNAENRLLLRSVIEQQAVSFAVEKVDAEEIDEVNILNASILGMQRCLVRLQPIPESIIIDGNKFKPFKEPYTEYNKIPLSTIVK
ncbi:MAG: ribonuclease HII, partial [Bacteroidales bacterium]|nr:ribonuclease HII [Bacteroidales bacterium]